MACGESEETVEKPKEEIVEKKVVKKDPAKRYKALVGLGKTKEVSEFLGKTSFSEQQKAEKRDAEALMLEARSKRIVISPNELEEIREIKKKMKFSPKISLKKGIKNLLNES